MRTNLEWKTNTLNSASGSTEANTEKVEFSTTLNDSSDSAIEAAIETSIEKAVSILSDNILDNSRYFLFEWDIKNSALNIVVTDDTKKQDSKLSVRCHMSALQDKITTLETPALKKESTQANSDLVKYFVKDYLTTCGAFMQFSLVAVFHNSSREKTELL